MADKPLKITYRATDSLVAYAQNSRVHSEKQVAEIAASISAFGFTNPVLVGADGTLIAGHGRLLAAKHLGLEAVPTIELAHLDESQRRALVIADNSIALTATWDIAILSAELRAIEDSGFSIEGLGLDEIDVELPEDEYQINAEEAPGATVDPEPEKVGYTVMAVMSRTEFMRWAAFKEKRTDKEAVFALLDEVGA